jgi:hypothetical protein
MAGVMSHGSRQDPQSNHLLSIHAVVLVYDTVIYH